ncbi:hypothetical protein MTO96_046536 [Rhipicephalus appendiculatus]
MCMRYTQTHVWLSVTPRCLYESRRASAGVPGPSSFVCAPTAVAPRNGSFALPATGSPSCAQCPAEETLEHILLQCPGYDDQRRQLFGVYGRLGLPHVSLDDLWFPGAHRSKLGNALYAVLDFFDDAKLFTRL